MAHKIRPRASRKAWNPLRLNDLSLNNSSKIRRMREQMEAEQAEAARYSQLVGRLQAMKTAKASKH
ncbi:hypothetical protein CIK76_05110 [Glutamicibacter sp. BW80]|nr:hypothetical protein CIK76_05110 [Glutamicibacter sp. BW80]